MQEYFYTLADGLTGMLRGSEVYTCAFSGEDSDFVRFNRSAVRQVIVVGDAPPHDEDREPLFDLIETMRSNGVLLNAVHVPSRRGMNAQWLEDYNRKTAAAFGQMAELGAGHLVTLGSAGDLVPAIMRFTIAEPWWPVFDEFYALYLELCR